MQRKRFCLNQFPPRGILSAHRLGSAEMPLPMSRTIAHTRSSSSSELAHLLLGYSAEIGETGSVLASRVPRWRRVRTPAAPATRSVEKAACVPFWRQLEGTRAAAAAEESTCGDMTFPPAGSPAFFDLRTMDAPTTPAIRSASAAPRTSKFVINWSDNRRVIMGEVQKKSLGFWRAHGKRGGLQRFCDCHRLIRCLINGPGSFWTICFALCGHRWTDGVD